MTRMTTRIEDQIAAAEIAVADLETQLQAKREELRNLSIALDVVRNLVKSGSDAQDDGQPGGSLRDRILKCFEDGQTHTKDDVAKTLSEADPTVNEATVGSLLSRYVKFGDLEKMNRGEYRLPQKDEGPAVGTEEPSNGTAP